MRTMFLCGLALAASTMPAAADITGMPPIAVVCVVHQPVTAETLAAALDTCQAVALPEDQAKPMRQTSLHDLNHPTRELTWGMPKPAGAP